MALDEADKAAIKGMFGELFKAMAPELAKEIGGTLAQATDQKLAALKAEFKPAEKAAGASAEGRGAEKAPARDAETERQIQQMTRQLRHAEARAALPSNINPERAGAALELLEARGRLVSRDGAHYVRIQRNGVDVEVPLGEGLKEWASTKDAELFALPPASGSGAQGGHALTGGVGQGSVRAADVLAKGLREMNK